MPLHLMRKQRRYKKRFVFFADNACGNGCQNVCMQLASRMTVIAYFVFCGNHIGACSEKVISPPMMSAYLQFTSLVPEESCWLLLHAE